MDRIEKVELIVDAGEYSGSFVKLQPITFAGDSAEGTSFAQLLQCPLHRFLRNDLKFVKKGDFK